MGPNLTRRRPKHERPIALQHTRWKALQAAYGKRKCIPVGVGRLQRHSQHIPRHYIQLADGRKHRRPIGLGEDLWLPTECRIARIVKLDSQRGELAAQRDELTGWLARRQRELAQQAKQIGDRERALDRENRKLGKLEKLWQAERSELQRQLRKLSLQMRQNELAAA